MFPIVPVPFKQTVGNEPFQNIDEDKAPLRKFEEMNDNKFFEQMDQENEVAQSEQINNEGDDTEKRSGALPTDQLIRDRD